MRMAIQGFASDAIGRFFLEGAVPKRAGWAGVARVAARKLDILDYANTLADLASPPGNRLEALKGDLEALARICTSCAPPRMPEDVRRRLAERLGEPSR